MMGAERLRALNVPMPVVVETDGQGLPVTVLEVAQERAGACRGGQGGATVTDILETWRVDDEWWRNPVSRRYVEVALEGGGHVVLFENLVTGNWSLQMP